VLTDSIVSALLGIRIPHLKTLILQRTFDRVLRRSLQLTNPDHH
jgi:hypothetical protein